MGRFLRADICASRLVTGNHTRSSSFGLLDRIVYSTALALELRSLPAEAQTLPPFVLDVLPWSLFSGLGLSVSAVVLIMVAFNERWTFWPLLGIGVVNTLLPILLMVWLFSTAVFYECTPASQYLLEYLDNDAGLQAGLGISAIVISFWLKSRRSRSKVKADTSPEQNK